MPESDQGCAIDTPYAAANLLTADQMMRLWRKVFRLQAPHHYPKNFRFYSQGSIAEQVFLLEHGLVKLTRLNSSGREALVWLRCPGEFLGAPPALRGRPYAFSATAVTECCAHRLTIEQLSEAVATNADAASLMMSTLSDDLFAVCGMLIGVGP
jgi:CRP-like cAMP-binding protein